MGELSGYLLDGTTGEISDINVMQYDLLPELGWPEFDALFRQDQNNDDPTGSTVDFPVDYKNINVVIEWAREMMEEYPENYDLADIFNNTFGVLISSEDGESFQDRVRYVYDKKISAVNRVRELSISQNGMFEEEYYDRHFVFNPYGQAGFTFDIYCYGDRRYSLVFDGENRAALYRVPPEGQEAGATGIFEVVSEENMKLEEVVDLTLKQSEPKTPWIVGKTVEKTPEGNTFIY